MSSEPIGRSARYVSIWERRLRLPPDLGARSVELLGHPNGVSLLVNASLAGLAVVALYRFQHRLGAPYVALFAKEGPFEDLTFILAFVAAAWCAGAVWKFWRMPGRHAPARPVQCMYIALAAGLFAFGMEEINWGQTLLGFRTPDAWKAVNYQQETSLHNLLNRDELENSARTFGLLLTGGVIALAMIRLRWPKSLLAQIAPPAALVPLSLCVAYASLKQHSEVVELLVAVFFAFYTYRLWRLSHIRAGR